ATARHPADRGVGAAGRLRLMEAAGGPPLAVSQEAHAGCLSFELSARQNRIVVNCGLPVTSRDNWRQVARATAAHSTVTFNDTSSGRFIEAGAVRRMLYGAPMIAGPRTVTAVREERPEGLVLRTSHDRYADVFNVIPHRVLMLSADGPRPPGEGTFAPARHPPGSPPPPPPP